MCIILGGTHYCFIYVNSLQQLIYMRPLQKQYWFVHLYISAIRSEAHGPVLNLFGCCHAANFNPSLAGRYCYGSQGVKKKKWQGLEYIETRALTVEDLVATLPSGNVALKLQYLHIFCDISIFFFLRELADSFPWPCVAAWETNYIFCML